MQRAPGSGVAVAVAGGAGGSDIDVPDGGAVL